MNEATKPATFAGTMADWEVRTWAAKSVRECVSIASRAPRRGGSSNVVDPATVEAVLGRLIVLLEAERMAFNEGGALT